MSKALTDCAPLGDLTAGYTSGGTTFECLFCDHRTRKGHVYRSGQDLVEAETAMGRHLEAEHGSVFDALLGLGKKGTGLSDTQRALLGHFHAGLSDREIQPLAGGVSLSTIRNHRFTLREKARQAKVFLALMELLERGGQDPGSRFIAIPGRKAADDERFAITQKEYAKIIQGQFPDGPDGRMIKFPKKEKRKIAVMIHVLKRFDPKKRYTQQEVNEVLSTASDDHTTLGRFLVDYGFLGRTRDGSEYWVE
jgi:hypothetical protein